MVRLVGVDLPRNKRVAYALTYIHGIGIKTAGKIINHLHDEEEMDSVCRSLYDDEGRYCMNMQCLYIWRTPVL